MHSNKKQTAITLYQMGYRIINNVIINPTGIPLKGFYQKNGESFYHFLSLKIDGKSNIASVHHLVAYEKFGNDFLTEGIQVRHLDGNSLNNNHDNIALGTPSENMMDRAPEDRQKHAVRASSFIHRLKTEQEIIEFLQDRANGMSFKQLAKKWQMALSTISCLFNKADYLETAAEKLGFNFAALKQPLL